MSDAKPLPPSVPASLRAEYEHFSMPGAEMVPTMDTPDSPTQSYIRGYPYVPEGDDLPWPLDADGRPMLFLVQVNFSEVPPLPGFPTSGLLQWFCGSDDTYGLTFDGERQGIDGLHVRWFSAEDLSRPATHLPSDPVPTDALEDLYGPVEDSAPVAVKFLPILSVPGLENSTAVVSSEYADALCKGDVPGPADSGVGGYPDFVQNDPRQYHPDRVGTLLVQLGACEDLFLWGDSGTAQLFGDPAALAKGDLSSLWWDWACC